LPKPVRDYLYQLVAYHAESLTTPKSVITTTNVYHRLINEFGDATLHQVDPRGPQKIQTSMPDRITGQKLAEYRQTHGLPIVPVLFSKNPAAVLAMAPTQVLPTMPTGSAPRSDLGRPHSVVMHPKEG